MINKLLETKCSYAYLIVSTLSHTIFTISLFFLLYSLVNTCITLFNLLFLLIECSYLFSDTLELHGLYPPKPYVILVNGIQSEIGFQAWRFFDEFDKSQFHIFPRLLTAKV